MTGPGILLAILSVVRILAGTLLGAVGSLLLTVGFVIWALVGPRAVVILYEAATWGTMMIGLSLTALWPERRLACFAGALFSFASLLMVDSWEHVKPPDDWTICKLGAIAGMVIGLVVGMRKRADVNTSAGQKNQRTR